MSRARHLLPVLVQLSLPLVHVGGTLLKSSGQAEVVALQRGQLDLPLLGVCGAAKRESFDEPNATEGFFASSNLHSSLNNGFY